VTNFVLTQQLRTSNLWNPFT